jgi:phage shock protein A
MKSIQQVRSALKQHPLVAVGMIAMLGWFSVLAALVLGVAAAVCFFAPRIIEKHAPEIAVEDAVHAARQHGMSVLQRAQAVKADEIGLRRQLDAELLAASLWESRATKATLRNDDATALECLAQQRDHEQRASALREEVERQRAVVAAVLPSVERAKEHAARAERSGLFLVIRKRRAETRKAVAFESAGLDTNSDAFTRIRADVERAEDEAQALEEVLGSTQSASVAERFEQEERDDRLRADLEELKRKVGMKRPALTQGAA